MFETKSLDYKKLIAGIMIFLIGGAMMFNENTKIFAPLLIGLGIGLVL